jgi:hypothetical protein
MINEKFKNCAVPAQINAGILEEELLEMFALDLFGAEKYSFVH